MKRISFLLALLLSFSYAQAEGQKKFSKRAPQEVIERVYPSLAKKLVIEQMDKTEDGDVFKQEIRNGKLIVKGSSEVAICRGVYDFIRNNKYGISSWTGTRLQLPASLDQSVTREVTSPFAHHYYYNVVTYGYTMPYWDWNRWEKEIDWMALHGIDMPLALVANEAISARVWKKLGLTDTEIAEYFSGPAHLPWLRMGNLSKIDGPLPQEWHQDQVALQHKILQRMKSLGMKPICPAFAGFVPQAMKRLYPNIKITETLWGHAFHNWMLSPEEDLFHTLGEMFIKEWEKEFGKNEYYIADSFNEMDIPFPPKEDPKRYTLLASYGDKVYQSIKAGDKDAVWVMQGWMFGYQRHIWDYKTLQALVSKVPDDKMLLLDLAVDYNRCFWKSEVNWEFYKGFYNKPWVYSVIPNMGGKSGLTGILSFYANGHLDALNSKNKGRLDAFGMAPEGIENNEVVYELITDAGWSNKKIDVEKWLADYSSARYGCYTPAMKSFWDGMLKSVYGSFTDHPRYNWQFRPGSTRKGSINANDEFYKGIESLADGAKTMKGNALFEADFREWTAAYLGGKIQLLSQQIDDAYLLNDVQKATSLETKFVSLMKGMDEILSGHPTARLDRWIQFARNHGKSNPALADYYEKNARRIITIWGPPIDDYSARIWSGLIRDYYLPRWQHYFEQKKSGQKFDFAKWERNWVEQQKGLSNPTLCNNPIERGISLIREASSITSQGTYTENIIGSWQTNDIKTNPTALEWSVPVSQIQKAKGIKISQLTQDGTVTIHSVVLTGDGQDLLLSSGDKDVSSSLLLPVTLPASFTGNNECKMKISVSDKNKVHTSGKVELVY